MAMALKHPKFANWPARRVNNVQRAPEAACEALIAGSLMVLYSRTST